jgi:hypothetical protein
MEETLLEINKVFPERKAQTWSHYLYSESKKHYLCSHCHVLGKKKVYTLETGLSNLTNHIRSKHPEKLIFEKPKFNQPKLNEVCFS